MLKRITISLFCLFLIIVSTPISYGASAPTGYTPVTSDQELAQSFNDYCKSRDAKFTSSMPGATYTYIYDYMKKSASALGYNIDEMQEGLYKSTEAGGGVMRWYMSSQLIGMYNDLFAYLINENELSVGDTADINLYSGRFFQDSHGYAGLVWDFKSTSFQDYNFNNINSVGTSYQYNSTQLLSLAASQNNVSIVVNTQSKSYTFGTSNWNGLTTHVLNNGGYIYYAHGMTTTQATNYQVDVDGGFCIASINGGSTLYYGRYSYGHYNNGTSNFSAFIKDGTVATNSSEPVNIAFVTIDNKTINNNNYQGDTIITNEGDVINNNPGGEEPGGHDPGWDVGGGQGSYEDNNGNSYTINFPDFELPDLNIDWSIQGLGNKFPFSIPFDIASLVSVLNAEPEAPRFEGTVNFGFTTWDYDINLEQFDSVAHACRIAELLLLVFGLILITRSIIKG